MTLHSLIMNIEVDPAKEKFALKSNSPLAYKMGHRDARHAAAELALKTEELESALRLFMAAGAGHSTDHAKQALAHSAGATALQRMTGMGGALSKINRHKDPSRIAITPSESDWLVKLTTSHGGRLEKWHAKPSSVPPTRAMNGLVAKGLALATDSQGWEITPLGRERCKSIY